MADKSNHFIDYVKIHVKAGDGGQGCISFLRDRGKPFGGPNGGDGGRGGSVYLEADEEMTTLLDFKLRPSWVAERGEHGLGKNMSGVSSEEKSPRRNSSGNQKACDTDSTVWRTPS